MNQTFPWFEWIIVDDGSTDKEQVEYVNQLIKDDPRINMIHKENGGPASARNVGIEQSTTPYILPIDADDLIEPTGVEYCWWMLEKNPEAAWAIAGSCGFGSEDYLWLVPFDPEKEKKTNLICNFCMIRKSWLEKVGGYAELTKHYNEDWHLWLKLMAEGGYPVQSLGEPLFWYRRSNTGELSLARKDANSIKLNAKYIREIAEDIIETHNPVIFPAGSSENSMHAPMLSNWSDAITKSDKDNILFIFPWIIMGGADRFNLELLKRLDRNKYNAIVVTTVPSENLWLQQCRKYTDQIFNLPNFMYPSDYPEFISYIIQSRKIKLIFLSNSYLGYYLLPWIKQNFPSLAVMDYVHMEEWYWRQGGYARPSSIMENLIDHTYVCNTSTEKVMINDFGRHPDSVTTVHIGIDSHYFDRNRIKSGFLYKKFHIDQNRPVVLFICRIHPQKRPFMMVEIADELKERVPDVAFVVVGDGPQLDELRQEVYRRKLDDTVFFAGAQDEVRPFYRDAKATLICSTKEGLALTAYESCSMGVPVVSADVGGQADLIDESVGALIPFMQDEEKDFDTRKFPAKEVTMYVDALNDLITDEKIWNEKSLNCLRKIENKFDVHYMTDYFNREFDRIIRNHQENEKHNSISDALKLLGNIPGDIYSMSNIIEAGNKTPERFEVSYSGFNNTINQNVLDDIRRQLFNDEIVLNRHEEVVNRHEKSINHQWEVQKWHEQRIQNLEGGILRRAIKKIRRK